ncbi:hypothetical protein BGZ47_007147 [Haplosporangium gracile]|nr:hypothetical protein BGZ47_007147 [Haplosporangium gracile]
MQDNYRWLIEQLVRAFTDHPLKGSAVVTEIVFVGPVLNRDTYRSLFSCFISNFERTIAPDVTLLQGSWDGTIRIWEVTTGESRVLVDGGSETGASTVVYTPDSLQVVARRSRSDCVELWDAQSAKLRYTLQHDGQVDYFALSCCGLWIATGYDGNTVWL